MVICGGGNGTHVLSGIVPTVDAVDEVYVLSTFADEAEKFSKAAATQNGEVHIRRCKEGPDGEDVIVKGKPTGVTNDPSIATKADVIVFAVPAFAHGGYLKAIKPYIRKRGSKAPGGRVILGAMPGESGFDMQVQHILGDEVFNSIALFALETLPWAARLTEYGKSADILGTKFDVDVAVTPRSMGPEVVKTVQKLMANQHPRLHFIPSMLVVTLMNINQVWHPTITWGQYREWDWKTPFDKPPLFYEGVDEVTGDMLSKISDEILQVKQVLESRKIDMTGLRHVKDWMVRSYGDDIGDKSSLHRMMNTNKGYLTLTHPMVETKDGKYMPNFKYRYMTEDVPMGLVVTRGIAELCGVETPHMDTVINFASRALGKSFIVDGKLEGPDVGMSRSPQAFGFHSLDELIQKLNY